MTKKIKMPKGIPENEVLQVIERIAKRLATRFRFGYHTVEDMRQQARLYAWEGLAGYDGLRPLENYLWKVVHNRLFNFKRDNYMRPECPCNECKHKHCDKTICKKYLDWYNKNSAKVNVVLPISIHSVDGVAEQHMEYRDDIINTIMIKDILKLLNDNLSIHMRADFIKLQNGIRLAKYRRTNLLATINAILMANGYKEEADKCR